MLTNFAEVQHQFANYLRDPQRHPAPPGLEDRRLAIYRDLIFRNLESFISSGFPVLRSLYSDADWQQLVRDFIASHRAHSPYFLQISEEFLTYLREGREPLQSDPVFIQELAHYEWVELALDISELVLPDADGYQSGDDVLQSRLQRSPLAWLLSYQFPVHRLGPDYRPTEPPADPTYLIVYRDRSERVQFMESNAVTFRLLNILEHQQCSGEQALRQLADEMRHPAPEELLGFGQTLLQQLCDRSILR